MEQDYLKLSEENRKRAFEIIAETGLVEAWHSVGATVNLVGSLKMGLMMKHRDIDFHVYTPVLDVFQSYRAMGTVAAHPRIKRVEFVNLAHTDEACLEWHAWYEDADAAQWQFDVIHILKGSRYDGYFERMAIRILSALTDETRHAILRLKYETPEDAHVMGVEYYKAVLCDGVRSYDEFCRWRESHPVDGIMEWMP